MTPRFLHPAQKGASGQGRRSPPTAIDYFFFELVEVRCSISPSTPNPALPAPPLERSNPAARRHPSPVSHPPPHAHLLLPEWPRSNPCLPKRSSASSSSRASTTRRHSTNTRQPTAASLVAQSWREPAQSFMWYRLRIGYREQLERIMGSPSCGKYRSVEVRLRTSEAETVERVLEKLSGIGLASWGMRVRPFHRLVMLVG